MTSKERMNVRIAYVTDADRALEMLATNLTTDYADPNYHLWETVREIQQSLWDLSVALMVHHQNGTDEA